MRTLLSTLRLLVPGLVLIPVGILLNRFLPQLAWSQHDLRFVAVALVAAALLLALRFHSLRGFLAAASLPFLLLSDALTAAVIAVNFVLLLLVDDAFFDWEAVMWWGGLLVFEIIIIVTLQRADPALLAHLNAATLQVSGTAVSVPLFLTVASGFLLLFRFVLTPDALNAGLLSALIGIAVGSWRQIHSELVIAVSALILVAAVIERSYWIAYHDELTGLPGRRAFNEALAALGDIYSIAVVDVDHFKRFNDTYGHDTGDDVLRKVASHLARVESGKAFRCGGEEFAIVFPNVVADQAATIANDLRQDIADDEFTVRGPDRSSREDRADRRSGSKRRARRPKAVETSVTVSIGIAQSSGGDHRPEHVVSVADRALYAAKNNGRNRVEVFVSRRPAVKQPTAAKQVSHELQ